MYKAYCCLSNFSKNAQKLLENSGIRITMNNSKEKPNKEELIKLLQEYNILIIGGSQKLSRDIIKYIKRPIIIATLSVGLDHIASEFFESPFIKVINVKTGNSLSVAEHIFSLILALNKRIVESNMLVINGMGDKHNIHEKSVDISGKTLGLIGAGNITKEVIKFACVFDMKIKCYTKNPNKHIDLVKKGIEFINLDDLLKTSDIVSINIPLNNETKMLISKEKIALLKPTATFINAARADIVDIDALVKYADKYSTFYVGLDIDVDNYKELFSRSRNNVIVTPHIAGDSKQAIDKMSLEIANSIIQEFNH